MTAVEQLENTNQTFRKFLAELRCANRRHAADAVARTVFKGGPTAFAVQECVDGRVYDLEQLFGLPSGCMHYLRMPGGVAPLSDAFAKNLFDLFTIANKQGKRFMFLPSLHRANNHADGCAWFGNDFDRGVADALQLAEDCAAAFGRRYFSMILRAYNTSTGDTDCYVPQLSTWVPLHELDVESGNLNNLPVNDEAFLEPLCMLVRGARNWVKLKSALPQVHSETGIVFTDATFSLANRSNLFIVDPYLVSRTTVMDRLGPMMVTCAQKKGEEPLIAVILRHMHGDLRNQQLKQVEARVIARELASYAKSHNWGEVQVVFGVMSHKFQLALGTLDDPVPQQINMSLGEHTTEAFA